MTPGDRLLVDILAEDMAHERQRRARDRFWILIAVLLLLAGTLIVYAEVTAP